MLVKIASKDTETVINALIKLAGKLPEELYRSLTWDRGKEMAGHKLYSYAESRATPVVTTMDAGAAIAEER